MTPPPTRLPPAEAPPPPGVGGRRTYRCNPGPGAVGPGEVIVVDDLGDGLTAQRLLPHHVRHSPDGFAWGYSGSGPSDLARCILIDVLGDGGRCGTCDGTGRVIWRDQGGFRSVPRTWKAAETCPPCVGDGFSSLIERRYHRFKDEVVAAQPPDQPWTITADEVRAWLSAYVEAT